MEICWAAQRSGIYYTAISCYLTQDEIGYIVNDCGARIVIASPKYGDAVAGLIHAGPDAARFYMLDEPRPGFRSWRDAVADQPATPIAGEVSGRNMGIRKPKEGMGLGVNGAVPRPHT